VKRRKKTAINLRIKPPRKNGTEPPQDHNLRGFVVKVDTVSYIKHYNIYFYKLQ